MRAFGVKRTFGGCRTRRPRPGGKIQVRVTVKNRKRGRVQRAKLRDKAIDLA